MNPNMGTEHTGSNNDSFSGNLPSNQKSSSRPGNGHEGMAALSNQVHYGNYPPQAAMSYSQYNMYDKVGLSQSMTQEPGGMYDHHGNLYGNMHSNNHMTSDTNRSPPIPPRVYKPCFVCSDKGSGYHYGVSSCEGCKGFFRRSVQKDIQYTCHKDKNCVINKVTRNRCQSCRLQKCIAVGMCKEAVRYDKNKKRKQKPGSTSSNVDDLTDDDQTLLQDILEAHRDTTQSTGELVSSGASETATMGAMKKSNSGADESSVGSSDTFLWDQITELSNASIAQIVNFARRVPSFSSLSTQDQVTLLKAACLEIMILRISSRYDPSTDSLQFSNGHSLSQEQAQKEGLGPVAQNIFSFAASLKHINCDDTEFALLSCICLFSGDRSGLAEIKKVEQMQEGQLNALKHYILSRRPDQKHMFAKVLMKLTDLRSISVRGEKRMSPHALDCLPNLLMLPLARTSASQSHTRVMSPQVSTSIEVRPETVTSAPFRPYHAQGLMAPGSSPKPMPSVSTVSTRTYNSGMGAGNSYVGGNSSSTISSSSNSLLLATQSLTDGRNYSTPTLPDLDHGEVGLGDFASNSRLHYQPEGSNTSSKPTVGSSSHNAYGNGAIQTQNSDVLNLWKIHQAAAWSISSKNEPLSSEALKVIVKSVIQPFTDQFGPSSSFTRSPNSEAPSSGPLSSPNFLTGINHHLYMSPSQDVDAGMRMIYHPNHAVSSAEGPAYTSSSSSTLSAPPPYPYAMQSRLQHVTQPGLSDHDFIQELPPPSSSSSSSSLGISNFLFVENGDTKMMPNMHQLSEGPSLDRLNADLVPLYGNKNMNPQQMVLKDENGGTAESVWESSAEDDLVYRPHIRMSLSHGSSHEIDGPGPSVDQPSQDTQNGSIANMLVSSLRQDDESVDPRSSSSMSISQLIGGVLTVEPDHWLHYSVNE